MKKEIAIFVNTFLRDDLILRCVEECEKFIPNGRLYITDNGRMTDEKLTFYKKLEESGHVVYIPGEFNYWWRKGFNDKLAMLQDEKYVLKIDDDFSFDENSNIQQLQKYLEQDKDLGMIGGQVWHVRNNDIARYIFDVTGKQGDKYVLDHSNHQSEGYIYCDFIPDFWLAKREVFNNIQMEDNLQPAQGGHEVFFRRIYDKRMSGEIDWSVGYTNEVIAIHEKSTQSEEYKGHRFSGYKSEEYYQNIKVIKPGNVRK